MVRVWAARSSRCALGIRLVLAYQSSLDTFLIRLLNEPVFRIQLGPQLDLLLKQNKQKGGFTEHNTDLLHQLQRIGVHSNDFPSDRLRRCPHKAGGSVLVRVTSCELSP